MEVWRHNRIMYRLCNDLEKNKILKSSGFKDFKWWMLQDSNLCHPIDLHNNPDMLVIEKPLISRALLFCVFPLKDFKKVRDRFVTTFCMNLGG